METAEDHIPDTNLAGICRIYQVTFTITKGHIVSLRPKAQGITQMQDFSAQLSKLG